MRIGIVHNRFDAHLGMALTTGDHECTTAETVFIQSVRLLKSDSSNSMTKGSSMIKAWFVWLNPMLGSNT